MSATAFRDSPVEQQQTASNSSSPNNEERSSPDKQAANRGQEPEKSEKNNQPKSKQGSEPMGRSKTNAGEKNGSNDNNGKNKDNKASQKKKQCGATGQQKQSDQQTSEKKKKPKDDSGSGEATQTCGTCSGEFIELNYCVHCAESICSKCRGKHVLEQVEEFVQTREDANSGQRQVTKKINEITTILEQQAKNEESCYKAIDNDFKEIEKILIKRKGELKKEVKQRHKEVVKPLKESRKELEKEMNNLNSKFEHVSRVSLPPSGGHLSAYVKMSDSDYAIVCGSIVKCGECAKSYQDLKKKIVETSDVVKHQYSTEECGENLRESVKTYGEVQEKPKEEEEEGAEEDNKKDNDDDEEADDCAEKQKEGAQSRKTTAKSSKQEENNQEDNYDDENFE